MIKRTYLYLESISDTIIRFLSDIVSRYGLYFLLLFMGFVFINFYELATFNLSIDEEIGAFGKIDGSRLWITQGRWGVFLMESLIFVHTTMPFFPLAVFGTMISAALIFTNISHGNDIKDKSYYLLFPLFSAFPTWICLSEFNSNIMAAGLAVGAASASVLIFSKYGSYCRTTKSSVVLTLIQIVLNGFAISCYQSFLLFLIANYVGLLILYVIRENEQATIRFIICISCRIVSIIALSVLFYYFIDYIFRYYYGIGYNNQDYINAYFHINRLIDSPFMTVAVVIYYACLLYLGVVVDLYLNPIPGSSVIFVIGAFCFLSILIKAEKNIRILLFFLFAVLLAVPFAFDFLYGNRLPYRTYVSLPYVVWFVASFVFRIRSRTIKLIGSAILVVFFIQISIINNSMAYSTTMARKHDRFIAYDIFSRISKVVPGFDINKEYYVYIYGEKAFQPTIWVKMRSSTAGQSFFSWGGNNNFRKVYYMRLLGYWNLFPAPQKLINEIQPRIENMPAWPQNGSVCMMNDVIVVKLSGDKKVSE